MRTAYPRNEKTYVEALEKDLLWWVDQHHKAATDLYEVSGKRRLDYILYEEGYVHYLRGQYATAASLFQDAVDAGFRAINRALDRSNNRDGGLLERARFALSNIWVSGLLERIAKLRQHLLQALTSGGSATSEWPIDVEEGIGAIYRALAKARESGKEGLKTGVPFLDAAREALDREHKHPRDDHEIDISEKRYSDFLRRHQLNAWLHSLEASSWRWLFGLAPHRGEEPDVPRPSLDVFRHLVPIFDRDNRISYRYRQIELLFRASGGERLETSEALHVAAMLRAAGSFEYLGDHLLLAWRLAKIAGASEEQGAIAWFLKHRVPDVGGNSLPKLALNKELGT